MITKNELDKLVQQYENTEFIKTDPIQLSHKYKLAEEIELIGFISSLFAFGNRKVFIPKLETLFKLMGDDPINYINEGKFSNLKGFNYRFAKENDIIAIFKVLSKLYNSDNSIKSLFKYGYKTTNSIYGMLKIVTDYFYANADEPTGEGFKFMLANPDNNGAMKRMNMYLRWMVRKPPVDFGLWEFIPTNELLIPLDTHVARVSRQMGLLTRKSNDSKAVIELTEALKKFDYKDPVKYDFAIYAKGINE